jgi:hypothetical protein
MYSVSLPTLKVPRLPTHFHFRCPAPLGAARSSGRTTTQQLAAGPSQTTWVGAGARGSSPAAPGAPICHPATHGDSHQASSGHPGAGDDFSILDIILFIFLFSNFLVGSGC